MRLTHTSCAEFSYAHASNDVSNLAFGPDVSATVTLRHETLNHSLSCLRVTMMKTTRLYNNGQTGEPKPENVVGRVNPRQTKTTRTTSPQLQGTDDDRINELRILSCPFLPLVVEDLTIDNVDHLLHRFQVALSETELHALEHDLSVVLAWADLA